VERALLPASLQRQKTIGQECPLHIKQNEEIIFLDFFFSVSLCLRGENDSVID